MKIKKDVDFDDGRFLGFTLTDDQPVRGSQLCVLEKIETPVYLPLGWYLYFCTSGDYHLMCKPTDADVLTELSAVLRRVEWIRSGELKLEYDDDRELMDVFYALSRKDDIEAWRDFAIERMRDNESSVKRAAHEIAESLSENV